MKVLFLTEGGKNIGYGHVARCVAIAQTFQKHAVPVQFVVNGDKSVLAVCQNFPLQQKNWIEKIVDIKKSFAADDLIIIDSYLAPLSVYQLISQSVSFSLAIDDNLRLKYPNSAILNGAIGAENLHYYHQPLQKLFLGSQFALLREPFWSITHHKPSKTIQKVLISFGGTDTRNLTAPVLELIQKHYPAKQKFVLLNSHFSDVKSIERLVDANTHLIYNADIETIKKMMAKMDVAISAGGQTLYELACCGVPTIAIEVADNQHPNICEWQKAGFLLSAGKWNGKKLWKTIVDRFGSIQEQTVRKKMSGVGQQNCDGSGAERLVAEILKSVSKI